MDKSLKPGRQGSVLCAQLEIDSGNVVAEVVGLMVVVVVMIMVQVLVLAVVCHHLSGWWWQSVSLLSPPCWLLWWCSWCLWPSSLLLPSSPMVVGTRGGMSNL